MGGRLDVDGVGEVIPLGVEDRERAVDGMRCGSSRGDNVSESNRC